MAHQIAVRRHELSQRRVDVVEIASSPHEPTGPPEVYLFVRFTAATDEAAVEVTASRKLPKAFLLRRVARRRSSFVGFFAKGQRDEPRHEHELLALIWLPAFAVCFGEEIGCICSSLLIKVQMSRKCTVGIARI